MILVSKSISLSKGILCFIYRNLNITHSHKHEQFLPRRSIIGSIKVRDMIYVLKSNSTRAREFNGASKNILKSRNHALHDIRIFIDAPLNFPAPVDLLNTIFFIAPNSSYTKN